QSVREARERGTPKILSMPLILCGRDVPRASHDGRHGAIALCFVPSNHFTLSSRRKPGPTLATKDVLRPSAREPATRHVVCRSDLRPRTTSWATQEQG